MSSYKCTAGAAASQTKLGTTAVPCNARGLHTFTVWGVSAMQGQTQELRVHLKTKVEDS